MAQQRHQQHHRPANEPAAFAHGGKILEDTVPRDGGRERAGYINNNIVLTIMSGCRRWSKSITAARSCARSRAYHRFCALCWEIANRDLEKRAKVMCVPFTVLTVSSSSRLISFRSAYHSAAYARRAGGLIYRRRVTLGRGSERAGVVQVQVQDCTQNCILSVIGCM